MVCCVCRDWPGPRDVSGTSEIGSHHLLQLAEELGAHSLNLPGRSVAETILEYARRHNVTKVIAGKPLHPRWLEMLHGCRWSIN